MGQGIQWLYIINLCEIHNFPLFFIHLCLEEALHQKPSRALAIDVNTCVLCLIIQQLSAYQALQNSVSPRNPVPPPPRPPSHSVLFRVRICLFPPFESPPPPLSPDWQNFWTPLSGAFPALETPLNPKHCSMYPLYFFLFLFYNPLFKFLRRPRRERKKNHLLF